MISEFAVYFRLGIEHILDPRGYDHLLFLVALAVMYVPRAWRQVVVLVTAFTVGHSVTLALATVDRLRVSPEWVEFLIPVTILGAAALNVAEVLWTHRQASHAGARPGGVGSLRSEVREGPASAARHGWDDALEPAGGRRAKYGLALVFGLVHGLGFSSFLRAALGPGEPIVGPLFAFNVGLEVGQVVVVVAVLAVTAVATGRAGIPRRWWVAALSGATGAVSVYLALGRVPF